MICLASCLTGCGERPVALPPTYPVHGRVTYRDGAPLGGGLVQFQSQADLSVVTSAAIQKDGTYALATMRNGLRTDGAVAGPNRVMVVPADDGNVGGASPVAQSALPIVFPMPYNVEPRDNEFPLVVEQPPRK